MTFAEVPAQFAAHFTAAVTAEKRKKHGIKTGQAKGKFPISNRAEALSAIKLRHNAKPPLTKQELSNLLTRAAKYAPEEAAAARKKDRDEGRL